MSESHELKAKGYFNEPQKYLHRRFGVRIRRELVAELSTKLKFSHVLDIGCGDGSISRPLLEKAESLTLLDLSGAMLQLAAAGVPTQYKAKVRLVQGSYSAIKEELMHYDLVPAIGLLAHLRNLNGFFDTLAVTVRSGGHLIVQFSSACHPVTRLSSMVRRQSYPLTRTRRSEVEALLLRYGFTTVGMKRFNFIFPGWGNSQTASCIGMKDSSYATIGFLG